MKALIIIFIFIKSIYGYELFIDTDNKYNLKEIVSKPFLFQEIKKSSYEMSSSTYWIKIKLHNFSDSKQKKIIVFESPFLKYVNAYNIQKNDTFEMQKNGYMVKREERHLPIKDISFDYELEANETKEVFISVKDDLAVLLHFKILKTNQFISYVQTNTVVSIFIFSGLIILFFYNLLLAFSMRKTIFLFYLGFMLGNIIIFANMQNLFYFFYPIEQYRLELQNFGFLLIVVFSILLLWKLLFKKIPKWLTILASCYVILKILVTLYNPLFGIEIMMLFKAVIIYFIFIIFIFIKAFNGKSPIFYHLFVGWSIFLLGGVFMSLGLIGFIDNSLVKYGLGIGTLLESIIFSLVISYQFRIIEKESFLLQRSYTNELQKEVEQRTQSLNEIVKQKAVLMRELHHRVKNNLQIISSLLLLQVNKYVDPIVKNELNEANRRITSIAILHDKLFQSNNLNEIFIDVYIDSLIDDLKQCFKHQKMKFDIKCDSIILTPEESIAIGLILNEVVSNAFKYAFDENTINPCITIKLYESGDEIIFEISDNGKGFTSEKFEKGFGMKLMKRLSSSQLKGTLTHSSQNGVHYCIEFSKMSGVNR